MRHEFSPIASIPNEEGNDLEIYDNKVYCNNLNGLSIFDISVPANPLLLTQLSLDEPKGLLIYYSNYLYHLNNEMQMVVIDVNDPENPIVQNIISTNLESFIDIYIEGYYLFISDINKGILIFDLSNPLNPNFLGTLFSEHAGVLRIRNNIGFVSNTLRGLIIYDFTDVLNPIELNSLHASDGTGYSGLEIKDNLAYCYAYDLLDIIDVSYYLDP